LKANSPDKQLKKETHISLLYLRQEKKVSALLSNGT